MPVVTGEDNSSSFYDGWVSFVKPKSKENIIPKEEINFEKEMD